MGNLTNLVAFVDKAGEWWYNVPILSQGNLEERGNAGMTGYSLVFMLLLEIERLRAELQKYKDNETKN